MSTAVVDVFAALGDPVRSAIVDRLADGDATVGELADLFPITLQAVSQQIGTLERAGLVTRQRVGRTRRVHLEPATLAQASQWMEARRQRLEERYQRLDEVLADVLADDGPDAAPGDVTDPGDTAPGDTDLRDTDPGIDLSPPDSGTSAVRKDRP